MPTSGQGLTTPLWQSSGEPPWCLILKRFLARSLSAVVLISLPVASGEVVYPTETFGLKFGQVWSAEERYDYGCQLTGQASADYEVEGYICSLIFERPPKPNPLFQSYWIGLDKNSRLTNISASRDFDTFDECLVAGEILKEEIEQKHNIVLEKDDRSYRGLYPYSVPIQCYNGVSETKVKEQLEELKTLLEELKTLYDGGGLPLSEYERKESDYMAMLARMKEMAMLARMKDDDCGHGDARCGTMTSIGWASYTNTIALHCRRSDTRGCPNDAGGYSNTEMFVTYQGG